LSFYTGPPEAPSVFPPFQPGISRGGRCAAGGPPGGPEEMPDLFPAREDLWVAEDESPGHASHPQGGSAPGPVWPVVVDRAYPRIMTTDDTESTDGEDRRSGIAGPPNLCVRTGVPRPPRGRLRRVCRAEGDAPASPGHRNRCVRPTHPTNSRRSRGIRGRSIFTLPRPDRDASRSSRSGRGRPVRGSCLAARVAVD
jgi:hypothetical protein